MTGPTETIARRKRSLATMAVVLSSLAYVAIGAVPYAVSGLVVPGPAVAVLVAEWAIGLVALVVVARRWPLLTPLLPIEALAFWFAFVTIGSRLFGWAP